MKQWGGKSLGPLLGYKFFLFSIQVFGLNFAYLVLRAVSFYYFLFVKRSRQSIIKFYKSALKFSASKARLVARKNFYVFGQTLIDRNAFLMNRGERFSFSFNNESYLLNMQQEGRGAILLSAHLGNWDMAGNLLKKRLTSKINVVMVDAEAEKIKKLLDDYTGGVYFTIIAVKDDLSHIIKIKNALDNNEMIAIHADRYVEGTKIIETDFFGEKAKFPLGPFLIASKFNVPVSFVFIMKEGKFHYTLTASEPLTGKLEPEQILNKYINELEKQVKEHPEQWFNYYDFYA